jgi:hypothetical protein
VGLALSWGLMLRLCKNWYPRSILALIKAEPPLPPGLLKKREASGPGTRGKDGGGGATYASGIGVGGCGRLALGSAVRSAACGGGGGGDGGLCGARLLVGAGRLAGKRRGRASGGFFYFLILFNLI